MGTKDLLPYSLHFFPPYVSDIDMVLAFARALKARLGNGI